MNEKVMEDLAYELKIVRYEKEDKLLEAIESYIADLDEMYRTEPPKIYPYMWESDRFRENFVEFFLKYLETLKSKKKAIINASNIFTILNLLPNINTFSYNNGDLDGDSVKEQAKKVQDHFDIILKYLEEYTPEDIWLLFKIREE